MSKVYKREKIEYNGQMLYVQEIAREEGLVASTLMKCYRQSDNIYDAVRYCKQISKPEGYIRYIEYNGQMMTVHAIAESEEISKEPLKRYLLELGDIYEAVKRCKEQARGEREKILYNGKSLSLNQIAILEGVKYGSLRNNYLKLGNIYEAVKITKQGERNRIEYNGEFLYVHGIAQRESINFERLRRIYSITGNIYEAVKIAKSTDMARREEIEPIEYNGEVLKLKEIAQREEIDFETLKRYYRRTGDIYVAVQTYREESKRKVKKIEYKDGERLAISVIAKREGIGLEELTNWYKQIGDIFEAVRICKENAMNRKIRAEQRQQEKEKNKIMYQGRKLELQEIASIEGIDLKCLTKRYKDFLEIYRAVFMTKYEQRKDSRVELHGLVANLYDMSLLIGIKHSDLINMLNEGIGINEIKEKYCNSKVAGEKIILRSGRSLLEFCAKEKLNYSFMYRAMQTYGKSCQTASVNKGARNKSIPLNWIYEKYENLLNKLGIKGLQFTMVIQELQEEQKSLEEALENFVIRKNARKTQISMEWAEVLYGLIRTREILGEEYQSQIQLNEVEKAFINECDKEILQMKNVIPCGADSISKRRRGALIEL